MSGISVSPPLPSSHIWRIISTSRRYAHTWWTQAWHQSNFVCNFVLTQRKKMKEGRVTEAMLFVTTAVKFFKSRIGLTTWAVVCSAWLLPLVTNEASCFFSMVAHSHIKPEKRCSHASPLPTEKFNGDSLCVRFVCDLLQHRFDHHHHEFWQWCARRFVFKN